MSDVIGMGFLSVVIFFILSGVFQSAETVALLVLFALPGMLLGCAYAICRKIDQTRGDGAGPGGTDRGETGPEGPK